LLQLAKGALGAPPARELSRCDRSLLGQRAGTKALRLTLVGQKLERGGDTNNAQYQTISAGGGRVRAYQQLI